MCETGSYKCFLLATSDVSFPIAVKREKEKASSSVCAGAEVSIVGLGQRSYSIHRLFCSVPYGYLIQKVSCSNKRKAFYQKMKQDIISESTREKTPLGSARRKFQISVFIAKVTPLKPKAEYAFWRQSLVTQITVVVLVMLT